MKHLMKPAALLFAVALIALSLCSCQALDEARDKQAFYNDTKTEIRWHDHTFKLLDSGRLDFITSYNGKNLCVTEADVPVLLSSYEGDWAEVKNTEETLIKLYFNHYYVREDKYDALKNAIDNAVLDHYFFTDYHDSYDDSDHASVETDSKSYWEGSSEKNILLDQDVTDVINKALRTSSDDKIKYDTFGTVKSLTVYPCDKNMLVTDNDKPVYLLRDGYDFYVWDGNTYDKNCICPVDKEGAALLKKLFDAYPESPVDDSISAYFGYAEDYPYSVYEGV